MDNNDMFDSILGDLGNFSSYSKHAKSGSDKTKTSDFKLDDILSEFGLPNERSSSSSAPAAPKKNDFSSSPYDIDFRRSDSPASNLADDILLSGRQSTPASPASGRDVRSSHLPAKDSHTEPSRGYNTPFDLGGYEASSKPKPKKNSYDDDFWESILASDKKNNKKAGASRPQSDISLPGINQSFNAPSREQPAPARTPSPAPQAPVNQAPAVQTAANQVPVSAPAGSTDGQAASPDVDLLLRQRREEAKRMAEAAIKEASTPIATPAVPAASAAAGAASAAMRSPAAPATPVKPIPRLLTEREEEDFKMRSGYIDLNALKAATASRLPVSSDKKSVKEATAQRAAVNTQQRSLYGKLGGFFSDGTFHYDTSSVNGITKDTINGKPRRVRKDKDGKVIPPENIDLKEEIDDIYDSKDLPDVEQELLFQTGNSLIKAILTAVLAVPLAILNLFPDLASSISPSFSIESSFNYAIANLCILFIIGLINCNMIGRGVAGIFTLKPTGSSLAALSVLMCAAHCVYIIASGEAVVSGMYSFVAALAVVFVLIGKSAYYRNVYKNFEILAFDAPKTACTNVAGGYSLKELYTEKQKITACRPVAVITRFLNNSFDYNFSDKVSRYSVLGALIAIVGSVLVAIFTNSVPAAFTYAAAAACAVAPFCYDLAYSLPMLAVSNKIRRYGSSVVSYTKAQDFAKTTTLVFCDNDLFRPENIIVHSMKINGNDRINDVIVNCASLIHESGSPVAQAFLNILDNKTEMLLPVYHFDWIPEKGYTGYINNVKYFVGTSQYLMDCGIKLPTIDLEEKYNRAGRKVIMFADATRLLAVFSISYCRDEQIYTNLHKINLDGFDILVLTRDSNITSELLAGVYDVDVSNFVIASKAEFDRLYHNNQVKEKHPAGIFSITGAGGITYALTNCRRLINTVKISVAVRTIAIACCAVVILMLTLFSQNALAIFSPLKMTLFHLMWLVPTMFISLFAG